MPTLVHARTWLETGPFSIAAASAMYAPSNRHRLAVRISGACSLVLAVSSRLLRRARAPPPDGTTLDPVATTTALESALSRSIRSSSSASLSVRYFAPTSARPITTEENGGTSMPRFSRHSYEG